jgi:hypothetical protein
MDCQTLKKYIEKHFRGNGEKMPMDDLRQHCDECQRCRDEYADLLAAKSRNNVITPHRSKKRKPTPSHETNPNKFPDISEPVEYKDAPLTFTLHLDEREEEIKVVEPQFDLPLPEGSRLVVSEKKACLCDVAFEFNPQSKRPYELHFRVMMGVTYAADHLVTFGTAPEEDENLLSVYRMVIVDQGGVRADIEMTRGKARLFIVYKPYQE